MPVSDDNVKSVLSAAYLTSVATCAGFPCAEAPRLTDALGIDATLTVVEDFGPDTETNFQILVQLKATSRRDIAFDTRGQCGYDLDVPTYDRYRSRRTANLMLVVLLVLPPDSARVEWLTCSPEALTIHGCAYWVSLYGAAATENARTVRVRVNRDDRLTVDALRRLAAEHAHGRRVEYDG